MLSRIEIDNSGERAAGQIAVGLESEAPPADPFGCEAVRRRPDADPAPLSFAQERLWFLNQINPEDVSSNIARAVRVKGPLDTEGLNRAFKTIIARHESLRTTFATNELLAGVDSQPRKLIALTGSMEFRVLDFSRITESDREQRARKFARDEVQRSFDLTLGPLVRLTLLELSSGDWVLSLNTHRIVCDEFSTAILFDELWECYRALQVDEQPNLRELLIGYADYAARQRELFDGNAFQPQVNYWRAKLAGAPALIELPTDRPRPSTQTWRGASTSVVLSKELTSGLRALSERENATLFSVLLAAFQVLLSRYSGQTDIVVGSSTPGRDLEATKTLIGPFANSLVLRADLSGNPTFRELLEQVERTTGEANVHQLPFEKLVEELDVDRSLSQAPVFQVMLNLKDPAETARELSGLLVEPFCFEMGLAPLDLTLNVTDEAERLDCRLEYNSDLFDSDTISRMAGHFRELLTSIASDSSDLIERLPLLTDAERRQIVVAWNGTERIYRQDEGIHELFEAQVARTPTAAAVICGAERLTYAELNGRANRLAHYLRALGVAPESRVGICLSRSVNMLVGVLAVLKAGGAYVPLDPAYPSERLAYMLKDSGAAVLLTEKNLLDVLPATDSVICLDAEWETIAQFADSNLVGRTVPANLAYVIYTSGSTGEPKGVAIQHSSTVAFLHWAMETFSPRDLEGVLASTSLCFDLSVFELFAPLCRGGKVVVAQNALQLRAAGFDEVTLVNTVPSAMAELVRSGSLPASVRTVNLAGEPLRNSLVQQIYQQETIGQVLNLYGPSEDTTYSTFVRLARGASEEPSIGVPVANTRAYVLDHNLEPAPIGVSGELYLGGAGLARGYLNRAALTAEKFVPDPFSGEPGARLYRTGDRARFRASGNLQFLGRADHQVKIRGFRIELGEIEATLKQHEAILDAVVIPREGNDALTAYVVVNRGQWNGGPTTLASGLRSHLAKKLPDYMTPAVFVELDALPLTPNGKVDRRALPAPDDAMGRKDLYVAPRNQLEETLCGLWARVLGVESVGVRDNFFEIGGHSLLAARLFAQIENRFARNLPLATLFQSPTIEQLAAALSETEASHNWASLVPIQPKGSKPPLFCIHACGPHVFIYRPLVRHLNGDQPVYGLQAQGIDGQREPFTRIADMAAHYIKEIREFQPHGPYYLLGDTLAGLFALEMAQQLVEQGEEVGLLAMIDTFCPLRPSLGRRLASHLIHLRELGIGGYVLAGARAVRNRLARKITKDVANPYAQTTEVEAARQASDTDDPLVKTEWAIYKAAYLNYSPPTKVFPGRIVYFLAEQTSYASRYEDNRLTWKKMAGKEFEVHQIPGRHDTVKEEPNVAILAEKLTACLERAEKEKGKAKAK
jgi:amino acid adenylation domain-containing protein